MLKQGVFCMQIQSINNYSSQKQQIRNPQFKAAYPVYHWVAEKSGGSYAPAVSNELNKKLQGIIVRLFNQTSKFSKTAHGEEVIKKLKTDELAGIGDNDYAFNSVVRTFNNKGGGWKGRFIPINYLITGNDVSLFDEEFGKPIGKSSVLAPKINGVPSSAEYKKAIKDYVLGGLNFVNNSGRKIKDERGVEYGLHTKFEVVRDKHGEVKDYELIDIKFCPETGSENPFVRTGYYEK